MTEDRRRHPARLWWVAAFAVPGVFLIALAARLGGAAGWWLAGCVVFGCGFTVAELAIVRRLGRRDIGSGPRMTASVVQPVPASLRGPRVSWRGGGAVPGSFGLVNASFPLAELELANGVVTLRLRLRLFGARPITLAAGDPGYLFPARGMLGAKGVGVQAGTGPPGYLWTRARAEVLSTAAAAGFSVDWREQRVRYM